MTPAKGGACGEGWGGGRDEGTKGWGRFGGGLRVGGGGHGWIGRGRRRERAEGAGMAERGDKENKKL